MDKTRSHGACLTSEASSVDKRPQAPVSRSLEDSQAAVMESHQQELAEREQGQDV